MKRGQDVPLSAISSEVLAAEAVLPDFEVGYHDLQFIIPLLLSAGYRCGIRYVVLQSMQGTLATTYRALPCYCLLALFTFFVPVRSHTEPYDDFQRVITAKEPFQSTDLISHSLLFSGVYGRDLESYSSQFRKYLAEVRSNVKSRSNTDYELGKTLLAYLHETRLKRYDSSQVSMDTLWKKGKFNCLSSSMFYLLCARSLGLKVEPVITPRHVFCRLKDGETWIDVETTTKYGFDPGTRNEFFDQLGRFTGATYIPPGNYNDREAASDRQLLSLLLQAQLSEKDPTIMRLAIDWFTLFPTKDSHRNLDYAFSYYVEWLNDEDLYDHALTFARHYKRRFESDPALRKSVVTLMHRQILNFIDKERFTSAEQLLDEGNNVLAVDLKRSLAETLLAKAMSEGKRKKQYAFALSLTSRLMANGHLPKARGDDFVSYLNAQQRQLLTRGK
jgi:hypothetical protein